MGSDRRSDGPRHFTYCFNRNGYDALSELRGRSLDRIWGRCLNVLAPGDFVYVVSVRRGLALLACRLEIRAVDVERGQATAQRSTPIVLDRAIPADTLCRLAFRSRNGSSSLAFSGDGSLNPQTLRGVRELTPESASTLDRFLEVESPTEAFVDAKTAPMRALSMRQPWAELVVRGAKTIEVRSSNTTVRERVLIYASQVRIDPTEERRLALAHGLNVDTLPRGVLIGSVSLADSRPLARSDGAAACLRINSVSGLYAWVLDDPRRAPSLLRPRNRPQPVWFHPF